MISIIDLNYSKSKQLLFTDDLVWSISECLKNNKKVLIFLNRRWEANCLVCKDCSFQMKCKWCDITLNVHRFPEKTLVCHQCWKKEDIPSICPNCSSSNLSTVWVWTQKIEEILRKIFKENYIVRLDSDKIRKEWISMSDVKWSDIVIATEVINTITIDNIWLVVFPLFESEMSIPEYDIEEKVFLNTMHNIRRWADAIIQTYIPNHPLIKSITSWTYNDFLKSTLEERKAYHYPPYYEFAMIQISSKNKQKVIDLWANLVNKLEIIWADCEVSYDRHSFTKYDSEWRQKIFLRWDSISNAISIISPEIFKNRELSLEWK